MTANAKPLEARRQVIYLHRSFRALRLNHTALFTAVCVAVLVSTFVVTEGQTLVNLHQRLAIWFTQLAGVAQGESESAAPVFPDLLPAQVPPVTVPVSPAVSDAMRVPALAVALLLLLATARNTITRGFFYFLLILLLAGTVALTLFPGLYVSAESVTQISLRSAFPIWLLMPWFASFLFIALNPDWRTGIVWTLGLLLHVFWTSALRQAFLLVVMHHTGILLFPLLWFMFGFLFDMLILLVVYSLSLNRATRGLWGNREVQA
jgi:hypothetical protein